MELRLSNMVAAKGLFKFIIDLEYGLNIQISH